MSGLFVPIGPEPGFVYWIRRITLLLAVGTLIFGIWWLLGIVVVGFSFLAGYGFARREWRKKGYVPRI